MNVPPCYKNYNSLQHAFKLCISCGVAHQCRNATTAKEMLKTQEQLSDIDVCRPANSDHAKAMQQASGIDATLQERGNRYGPFDGHAAITQNLKRVMNGIVFGCPTNWDNLSHDKKEALEMIAHKIGRILNGDPNYDDSWIDIAGYAQLVVNQLNGKGK